MHGTRHDFILKLKFLWRVRHSDPLFLIHLLNLNYCLSLQVADQNTGITITGVASTDANLLVQCFQVLKEGLHFKVHKVSTTPIASVDAPLYKFCLAMKTA